MKHVVASLVMLVTASLAVAGEPIAIGERVTLQSKILGEERTLLISTPADYGQSQGRYPVLYLTDGDAHLTHTRGTVDFLVRNDLIPSVIIVGVTNTDRTRDLTPTHANITEEDETVREFPTSGGGSRFLDFFERELFPYVESHYRTQPYRLFAGHSFGGLFALNALFTRPDMFDAILAVSPSLQWDDDLALRQAESFLAEPRTLNVSLFVAMADEEEGDPEPTRLDRLEAMLEGSSVSGLEWRVLRMPDETHGSVVLRAHYWGLRKVFQPWQLPRDPETGAFTGGLADLKQHYAGLSKRYGFAVNPLEGTVNQLGYGLLGRGQPEDALEMFRFNVELYPGSANVYDSLGEALEQAGRLDEALANYSRAVENATANGDERLAIFTTNLDRVKTQLETPSGT
jgi:predicted alpha/beta superfamily hydrolase